MSSTVLTIVGIFAGFLNAISLLALTQLLGAMRGLRSDVNTLRVEHAETRIVLIGANGDNGLNGRTAVVEKKVDDLRQWQAGVDANRRVADRRADEPPSRG